MAPGRDAAGRGKARSGAAPEQSLDEAGCLPPDLQGGGTFAIAEELLPCARSSPAHSDCGVATEAGCVPPNWQGGGAIAWEERPAPPAQNGANTLWFNIAYEKVGARCSSPPSPRLLARAGHFAALPADQALPARPLALPTPHHPTPLFIR